MSSNSLSLTYFYGSAPHASDGAALCDLLSSSLRAFARGHADICIAGAIDGHYRLPDRAAYERILRLLYTVAEDVPLTASMYAESDALCLTLRLSKAPHLRAHTRRTLLLAAKQASLGLTIEETSITLRFPASPETYALRHPTRAAEERLTECPSVKDTQHREDI